MAEPISLSAVVGFMILRFASPASDYLEVEAKARSEFLTEGYPNWQDEEKK